MNMTRWEPFSELETLSTRLNQLFNQPLTRRDDAAFAEWAPSVDLEEGDQEYLIKADLPDVKKENVKVGVQDGVLSLEGERQREKDEKTKKYHRVERVYGRFVRRMALPTDVDQQQISAEFSNGVLRVRLPKSAASKPRTVDVKVS